MKELPFFALSLQFDQSTDVLSLQKAFVFRAFVRCRIV